MRIIKYIIPVLIFIITSCATTKQEVDRSSAPEPKEAPEIQFSKPASFTLENGLEVIVAENHEMPVVSFQLTVDADPVKEGDAVGYVEAAGNLLRNGTTERPKAKLDEEIDFIGADLYTYTNGFYASSLKKHSEELLDVLSDITKNATFPKEEVDKYKQKQLSNLASSKTNASFIARRVAQKLRFGDHPYGELKTESSIENISRDLCLDYYKTYYKPNTSYLVMVGDLTLSEAREYANKYFGDWEKGEVPQHTYETPDRPDQTEVALVYKDDAVQSQIAITYPVDLSIGSGKEIKARVMNNILGGGVFSGYLMKNLREDKGYTYGARSSLNTDPLIGYFRAGAQVGTEVTDSAITEFFYEMNRIRNEGVEKDHLDMVQNVMTGSFSRQLENPRTYARFALNTKRYDLPDDYYANYLKRVNNVSKEDVQQMAREYILPDESYVVVVGDKSVVKERIQKFSGKNKVNLYNFNGEPVSESKQIPKGMTAEKIIEKYIEALGGRENLEKVKEIHQVNTLSMPGASVTIELYRKTPDKMTQIKKMNGMVMSKQVFDGEKGKIIAQGQEQQMQESMLKEMKFEAKMHKYLSYDELGIKTELVEMDQVKGQDVYKVKITMPNGNVRYDFYDTESGLKLQSKSKTQTQMGEIDMVRTFSDYKKVEGVKFPFTIKISGMRDMTMEVQKVEINQGIEESVFQ